MEKEEFKKLLKKYLEGKCTTAEQAILEAWYLEYNEGPVDLPPERVRLIGEKIYRELPGNEGKGFHPGFLLAAAAIGVIMVSLILQIVFHKADLMVKNHPADIAPGGSKAILTLANGEKIDLANARSGKLAAQQGISIFKNAAGQIIYQVDGAGYQHPSGGDNTITTPTGGIWEVRLPDGTRVWLNNSSSLRYPVNFAKRGERMVSLEGEAYFEVTKDKQHPFVVQSRTQGVRVLGTHFNVRAFGDEREVITTLLEGRVVVNSADQRFSEKLLPGKESLLDDDGVAVRTADTAGVIAWKNGDFRFQHTPIEQVMRELARWYGIEVKYEGPVSTEKLNGRISRSQNISKVLSALEATKTVHFKVTGRRVIVMN